MDVAWLFKVYAVVKHLYRSVKSRLKQFQGLA